MVQRIVSPDALREDRVPPGQHVVEGWPVLHSGVVPDMDPSRWRFRVTGLVEDELELGFEEFAALPRVEVLSDMHCVTGWSRLDNLWEGVSTGVLKDLVSIGRDARFVMVHGAGGFSANLSLGDFFQEDVLFAFKHDGRSLSPEHGGPVRLVVPRLYFWKSVKWVVGVEFMARERPGFWEQRGYHIHGDPWKEERYSRV